MATTRRRPAVPSLPPHAHNPAENEPSTYDGRRVCASCGKPGRAGDAQHPLESSRLDVQNLPDVPAEVQYLEARRLGELDDEGWPPT